MSEVNESPEGGAAVSVVSSSARSGEVPAGVAAMAPPVSEPVRKPLGVSGWMASLLADLGDDELPRS